MSNWEDLSARSKRRRIASEVSKMMTEMHAVDSNPDCLVSQNTEGASCLSVDSLAQPCEELYSQLANDESLDSRCTEHKSAGIFPSSIQSDDSSECSSYYDLNMLIELSDSKQVEANFNDFVDNSEWIARNVDSDDEDNNDENANDEPTLRDKLATWALRFNVSHAQLSALLEILKPSHPDLPKDPRTLLSTSQHVKTVSVAGGDYYYFGVAYWLQIILNKCSFVGDVKQITLNINIDGIPLFKSSKTCLWPILGTVNETEGSPFPIALYCSEHKPSSVNEFVKDFVTEMKQLEVSGFCNDASKRMYQVRVGAVICDAPARSFVKCIKTHNGYNCCERCVQHGQWSDKIILPDLNATLRSDASFVTQEDAGHHTDTSPFVELKLGMVSGFPLDYMHLICLGVTRRLIHQWVQGSRSCRLSQNTVSAVSERLCVFQCSTPREFSRKPRTLLDYKLWKATELRLFLIYTGPVVLKGLLSPEMYSNFLDLSVAARILLSPGLHDTYLDYADQLLKYFVQCFSSLYGEQQLVYNVHSLIHIADDARRFGSLDNVSSFKFESYLGQLKKLVRSPNLPCAQIVRRILEGSAGPLSDCDNTNDKMFKQCHSDGPVTFLFRHCIQYKQYHGTSFFLSTRHGDNCIMINGKIGLVRNILSDNSARGYVVFEQFTNTQPFFDDPLDSRRLNICVVNKLDECKTVHPISSITTKCVILPFKQGFVVMPQMHFS